jgi:hypothetical protein
MIKSGQTLDPADFTISLTAGEALSARDAVYISSSDGKAYKCDADDTSKINFVGFAQETASSGASVIIRLQGIMTGFSALTIGAPYYLSGTAGAITATTPTNAVIVGYALSATVIRMTGMPAVRISVFTASGTWTKLPGLKRVWSRIQAPGGGSGGADASISLDTLSGSGASGGYSEKTIEAGSLGATETVTVGAVGTAGSSSGGNGGGGGTTSFGSHHSATGGGGGNGDDSNSTGGVGGVGSGGDINICGNDGLGAQNWVGSAGDFKNGLTGGASVLGGAARGGSNGGTYGGGGGGVVSSSGAATAGTTGGPGIIIVTEYY